MRFRSVIPSEAKSPVFRGISRSRGNQSFLGLPYLIYNVGSFVSFGGLVNRSGLRCWLDVY
jgi:hypothetical protein